ncbi:MAG: prepilin-type N-terminal cleavage/methylation domain-containing protein, partial [Alphaproteobacteria bacterium]
MKNYSKKAFSLIEISIVILIIGLLIAGISKASDMLADSK